MRVLIIAAQIGFAAVVLADDSEKIANAQVSEPVFKPPPGYKTRHRGDTTVYCRKAAEIGSRFPVEKCFSEEQLKLELERIEVQKEEFERSRRVCSSDPTKLCGSS